MKFKGIKLTEEQEYAVALILSGKSIKVQASAGSGKTTLLECAAHKRPDKKGVNITFNKAIAESSKKKFPTNIICSTGHALAYKELKVWEMAHRFQKLTGFLLAKNHDIGSTALFPTPATKGFLILETIRFWCYSPNTKITEIFVPKIKANLEDETKVKMVADIVEQAKKIWLMMSDRNSDFPITHDTYLKMWALTNPNLNKDLILYDEVQDANGVILDIVGKQRAQKIYVGDSFQQIYSWRGAINALKHIHTKETAYITQSFRFGDAIADMANKILQNYIDPQYRPPLIKGLSEKYSSVTDKCITDPDCIICRTNVGVITEVFTELSKGKRVHLMGGKNAVVSLLLGAQDLMNGQRSSHPDLIFFDNWASVVVYANSPEGGDLAVLVKIINEFGIPKLMDALHKTFERPEEAEITITTAHKAKGLEWEEVRLGSDFPFADESNCPQEEEANLLYVAATRALKTLDISQCLACHADSLDWANKTWDKRKQHQV